MSLKSDTIEESGQRGTSKDSPVPGVVIVFCDTPKLLPIALKDRRVVLGRDTPGLEVDQRLSREHVEVGFDGKRWTVRDLGSRNGTFVAGQRVANTGSHKPLSIRVGRTILLPSADVRPYLAGVETADDMVRGPSMQDAFARITAAASAGDNLLITGESGTGKEHAARHFHATGSKAGGPLIVVNCATIQSTVAERLLFGARRGAYSGADNADGYIAAADHGVLFLDELGELDLDVQAKLLRVIETRELVPLGANTGRKIDLRFCFATHRDLRAAVVAEKFRSDLFHRVSQPSVQLPPLRERPEEIPWLVMHELAKLEAAPAAHASLIEACVMRHWPGNVRELLHHVRQAGQRAVAKKEASVGVEHLEAYAGAAFEVEPEEGNESDDVAHTAESISAALEANGRNVAATARALHIHRSQIYRLLQRFNIVVRDD